MWERVNAAQSGCFEAFVACYEGVRLSGGVEGMPYSYSDSLLVLQGGAHMLQDQAGGCAAGLLVDFKVIVRVCTVVLDKVMLR